MAHLGLEVFLLSTLLNVVPNCRAGSAVADIVSAVKEEDAVLLCLNPSVMDPQSSYRVRWVKGASESSPSKVIFEWPKEAREAQRVSVEDDRNGQKCFFLKSLQKSDEGLYSCEVWKGWDITEVKNISLKVKDCRTLDSKKATVGLPFKLTCQVNSTTPPPVVSWVKVKGNKDVSVNDTRVHTNGVFLTIQGVADSDSGWYRCNYVVGQSQRCAMINLQVGAEDVFVSTTAPVPTVTKSPTPWEAEQITRKAEGSETLFVVVVSVVSGVLLLAALTGLVVYYKCNIQGYRRQSQSPDAGSPADFYENLTLPRLPDPTNRVNSLYSLQDDSSCSFRN
ncbi:V-set and immunoglobulin domain-containing protein 1-like isoform X2 [Kryptolebias marmoratus]|uniref:V-set and immunoglobulin domain-containing protein 1-like isoform X2 n=1 Tax=Kryptolebias marmoratus TaxID=37003 RepID=UPI0018ACB9D2|nr:V-set and immunoglobulin domain-containing protein 1-like isoform X2 [Kryptolebias marmoratus]